MQKSNVSQVESCNDQSLFNVATMMAVMHALFTDPETFFRIVFLVPFLAATAKLMCSHCMLIGSTLFIFFIRSDWYVAGDECTVSSSAAAAAGGDARAFTASLPTAAI